MYGRIFKSRHILSYIDVDETYRRDIKGIRNLQEPAGEVAAGYAGIRTRCTGGGGCVS